MMLCYVNNLSIYLPCFQRGFAWGNVPFFASRNLGGPWTTRAQPGGECERHLYKNIVMLENILADLLE